jgi:hypothetical protein
MCIVDLFRGCWCGGCGSSGGFLVHFARCIQTIAAGIHSSFDANEILARSRNLATSGPGAPSINRKNYLTSQKRKFKRTELAITGRISGGQSLVRSRPVPPADFRVRPHDIAALTATRELCLRYISADPASSRSYTQLYLVVDPQRLPRRTHHQE